jgi:predicted DNA-binding transcriptional regulator AlpA
MTLRHGKEDKMVDKKLLSAKEVADLLSFSYQGFLRMLKRTTDFPKPIMLGERTQRWSEIEIQRWIDRKNGMADE